MMHNSLSIIIPALNEEKNIERTIAAVSQAAGKRFSEFEIFIFNDGSTDKTGAIAERLASEDEHITVIHHERAKCIGSIYKQGIKLARMNYVILVNGKCDISENELDKIFVLRGKADMIVPYTINTQERSFFRRGASYGFVLLLNTIFKLDLKYYNHYVLHKRNIINSIHINTDSYAFQAEALIKLIKSGHNYIEVGVRDTFEVGVKTKAFKLKNIFSVAVFFSQMIYEIYFKK